MLVNLFTIPMAVKILGIDNCTLPPGVGPTIVHMKKNIIPIAGEDWTKELIWESDPFRINTIAQSGLVHYHIDWIKQQLNRGYTTADRQFWFWLGADQAAHYLTYVGIIYVITG